MALPGHVEQTIADLEDRAHELEGLAVANQLMAHHLRSVFDKQGPELAMPALQEPEGTKDVGELIAECDRIDAAVRRIESCSELADLSEVENYGLAPRNFGSSKYKGVSQVRVRKDGVEVWRAQYSSKEGGRYKTHVLGSFDSELLAAAAVADHNGDHDVAEKFRKLDAFKKASAAEEQKQMDADIREQIENNPDRPEPRKHKYASGVWECNKCTHQHIVTKRPEKCESCGFEGMRKIA